MPVPSGGFETKMSAGTEVLRRYLRNCTRMKTVPMKRGNHETREHKENGAIDTSEMEKGHAGIHRLG